MASVTSEHPIKWAVVTGGSRGLGYETARGLLKAGHRVILVAKDHGRLKEAAEKLNQEFVEVPAPSASMASATTSSATTSSATTSSATTSSATTSSATSPDSPATNQLVFTHAIDFEATTPEALAAVQDSARAILSTYQPLWGVPSTLVVAHGVMSAKMSKTLRTDANEWRRVMSINLDSVFALVNVFGTVMTEARSGRIIIYSACLGRMSGPGNAGGLAPYRISKSGVNAMVRNLAHETGHGSRGFLIDAICPNHSRTDMGGPDAPRSAEEGAACAVWLATRSFESGIDQTGLLWEDREIVPW